MEINIAGDGNTVHCENPEPRPQLRIGFFSMFFLFVVISWVLVKFWIPIAATIAVSLLVWAHWYDQRRRRRAKAELLARADAENAAFLRGDEQGTYGNFPPVLRIATPDPTKEGE